MSFYELLRKKEKKEKIVMLHACDPMTAKIISRLEIDMVLVGKDGADCLGYNCLEGLNMENILFLAKSVKYAATKTIVVVELPDMLYKLPTEKIVDYASVLLKKSGVAGIKINCSIENMHLVERLVCSNIPVQGCIKFPANTSNNENICISEKEAIIISEYMERMGAFSILLDRIPEKVAKGITESLKIPTIGFGSGRDCDGQILNAYDIISYTDRAVPRFSKSYINAEYSVESALKEFKLEVLSEEFP